MNPLQKKCVLATAGFHLLLLVILFLGPGFFNRQTPPDTLPTLKIIPANAVDAALNSGSTAATPAPPTPPPPTPVVTPPPEPTSTPNEVAWVLAAYRVYLRRAVMSAHLEIQTC